MSECRLISKVHVVMYRGGLKSLFPLRTDLFIGESNEPKNPNSKVELPRTGRIATTSIRPLPQQYVSLLRLRNQSWLLPSPGRVLPDRFHVLATDPKQDVSCRNRSGSSPEQEGVKFAEGSRADIVERCDFLPQVLIPVNVDPDAG